MSEDNKDYFGLNNKEEELKPAEGSKLNEDASAEKAGEKPAKAKLTFSIGQVILIVVIALIAAFAIGVTTVSLIKDVNPVSYISGELHKAKLVNKWQSQDAPGLSAYEFFEDGTYSSYISTFSFKGNYSVQGDKLTLTNPESGQTIVYQYSIVRNTLTITLIEENGVQFNDRNPLKFDRVDMFNQKSLSDMLEDLQEQAEASTEEDTSEEVTSEEATSEEAATEVTTAE